MSVALINHTPNQAGLFSTVLDHESTLVIVAVKATYRFTRDGSVLLDDEVELAQMCEEGWQAFRLCLPFVVADVRLGGARELHGCTADTLVLYPDEWRYAVVSRRAFRCHALTTERRVVQLVEGHVA